MNCVTDLARINCVVDSVACLTNHIFVSPLLLEIGTGHHLEKSVMDGVNLIWGRSGYEWCKGWDRDVISALPIST